MTTDDLTLWSLIPIPDTLLMPHSSHSDDVPHHNSDDVPHQVTSVGWALSECHVADQRRIFSTTVSHRHEPPKLGNSPKLGNTPFISGNSSAEPNQEAAAAAGAAAAAPAAPAAPAAAEAAAAATAEEEAEDDDEWILLGSP